MVEGSIWVVTAMEIEFRAVSRHLTDASFGIAHGFRYACGRIGGGNVTVFRAGMGAQRFTHHLGDLLATHPCRVLIVAGLAGGLAAGLREGDLVIYDRVLFLDSDQHESAEPLPGRDKEAKILCDPRLSETMIAGISKSKCAARIGAGLTVPAIVMSADQKRRLGKLTGALTVDIESWHILFAATRFGLPCGVIRAISDGVESDLPIILLTYMVTHLADSPTISNRGVEGADWSRHARLLVGLLAHPIVTARLLIGTRRALKALENVVPAIGTV